MWQIERGSKLQRPIPSRRTSSLIDAERIKQPKCLLVVVVAVLTLIVLAISLPVAILELKKSISHVRSISVSNASDSNPALLRVTIFFRSAEHVSMPQMQVSTNGTRWRPMRLLNSSSSSVTTNLTERSISFLWDCLDDVGWRVSVAKIRAKPLSGGAAYEKRVRVSPQVLLREAAHRVNHMLVHYTFFNETSMELAMRHDLVIVHPTNIAPTREFIARMQRGVDEADPADDPMLLCYISVGEDSRTTTLNDTELAKDPRFRGNGLGPRVDPRGSKWYDDNGPLEGIDPLGDPSPGGTGFASFYLDDNSVWGSADPLGIPDRNPYFHGAFTNPGDPEWFKVLKEMLYDSIDEHFGMDELLHEDFGRGLGCDGLFLDTIDTAAPNKFTDRSSGNPSKYEWVAPGVKLFLERLRENYPDKLILQNRGVFFFNPTVTTYKVDLNGLIDFLFFESFRLNSNHFEDYSPFYFPDNLYNYAPRIMAEANRPGGFKVLSLGYAEGPEIDKRVLLSDPSELDNVTGDGGLKMLLDDVSVCEAVVGMRHYLTNAELTLANDFVLKHSNTSLADFDHEPPRWSSTWNPNTWPAMWPPKEAPPRVGIQKVISNIGSVLLQWDVALDLNRVHYILYYQEEPFDFGKSDPMQNATRMPLIPSRPSNYNISKDTYPYEYLISSLPIDTTFYFLIRAQDESPAQNEDNNTVALIGASLSSLTVSHWTYSRPVTNTPVKDVIALGPTWKRMNATVTGSALEISIESYAMFNLDGFPDSYSHTNIFVDLDSNGTSGWQVNGADPSFGSEFLIQGANLHHQTNETFSSAFLGLASVFSPSSSASPLRNVTSCTISVPLTTLLGVLPTAKKIRIVGLNDDLISSDQFRWIPLQGGVGSLELDLSQYL